MSIFSYFSRAKREERKHLRELKNIAATFSILQKLERKGLLYWNTREKQLLIEESLAMLMLSQGADKWQSFLQNVAFWQYYRLVSEKAENDRINAETLAIREAKKKYVNLTKADIERIRQEVRNNLPDGAPAPSEGLAFDIFIIRSTAQSSAQPDNASGELVAIGHWEDGKPVEMAMWEEVKYNFRKEEK